MDVDFLCNLNSDSPNIKVLESCVLTITSDDYKIRNFESIFGTKNMENITNVEDSVILLGNYCSLLYRVNKSISCVILCEDYSSGPDNFISFANIYSSLEYNGRIVYMENSRQISYAKRKSASRYLRRNTFNYAIACGNKVSLPALVDCSSLKSDKYQFVSETNPESYPDIIGF